MIKTSFIIPTVSESRSLFDSGQSEMHFRNTDLFETQIVANVNSTVFGKRESSDHLCVITSSDCVILSGSDLMMMGKYPIFMEMCDGSE